MSTTTRTDLVQVLPTARLDLELTPGPVATGLSAALAAVAALTCALTLFVPGVLTGPPAMNGSARGTALVALVVAVPALVTAMVLGRAGSVRAVPVWTGAVAYLLYNAVLFVLAIPFGDLFLLDVATLSLALWSLVTVLHGLDVPRFGALFARAAPVRAVAVYVWVVVGLNTLAWAAPVVRAMTTDGPPAFLAGTGLTTSPTYIQDLAFWLPAMAVAAGWLWRRAAWGFLVVGSGLVMWVVESLGIAVDQWLGHAADPGSAVASVSISPAFAVLAVVGMVPVVALLRNLPSGAGRAPGDTPALVRRDGWAWALVGVEAFVGAMAVLGGVRMIVDGFGMPTDWLVAVDVDSWVLPGIALIAGVAAPQLLAAVLVAAGSRRAVAVGWLAGAGLLAWIVVEMAVLQRYFFLQPVIALLGMVEVALLALWQASGPTTLPVPGSTRDARDVSGSMRMRRMRRSS
ncbi:MAG: hypothetical protein ACHQE5_06275 [Actinomycetes bacterium]